MDIAPTVFYTFVMVGLAVLMLLLVLRALLDASQ